MQTLIKGFVRGEFDVTAYGLIAAAIMLIGVGTWVIAAAPRHVVASPQINPLEMMANAKSLATPVAVAQNVPATFVPSSPAGGATGNPAVPGPNPQTGTRSHTKHHPRKIYMSAKSTHKHKPLKPAAAVRVAFPDLTHRSGADNVN
jgi:hypothetical protein